MKRTAIIIAVTVLFLGVTAQATQLAFPGAEGYGCYATGGRGGDVYHVVTIADYNEATEPPLPGTLRYGLRTATGPRTIVFDVSGYIDLKDRLEFDCNDITIAGQTAPGDGICFRKWDCRLYQADNTIVRYIRVRMGSYHGVNMYPYPYRHGGRQTDGNKKRSPCPCRCAAGEKDPCRRRDAPRTGLGQDKIGIPRFFRGTPSRTCPGCAEYLR